MSIQDLLMEYIPIKDLVRIIVQYKRISNAEMAEAFESFRRDMGMPVIPIMFKHLWHHYRHRMLMHWFFEVFQQFYNALKLRPLYTAIDVYMNSMVYKWTLMPMSIHIIDWPWGRYWTDHNRYVMKQVLLKVQDRIHVTYQVSDYHRIMDTDAILQTLWIKPPFVHHVEFIDHGFILHLQDYTSIL